MRARRTLIAGLVVALGLAALWAWRGVHSSGRAGQTGDRSEASRAQKAAAGTFALALAATAKDPRTPAPADAGSARKGSARLTIDVVDPRGDPLESASAGIRFPGTDFVSMRPTLGGHQLYGGLPPGTYLIAAAADGYARQERTFTLLRGQDGHLVLPLPETGSISGTVLDEAGVPVEGVNVYVETADGATGSGVETGKDGRFELDDLLPGDAWITTRDERHLPTRSPARVPSQGVHVEVREGASLQVRLRRKGQPVDAAAVSLLSDGHEDLAFHPVGPGAFERTGIPPGRYALWVRQGGCGDTRAEIPVRREVVVRAEEKEQLSLELPPWGCVSGSVIDPAGSPMPQAFLEVTAPEDPANKVAQVSVDGEGRFLLGASPGEVVLHAFCSGYANEERHVALTPGQALEPIVLHPLARLSGRVLAEDGTPITHFVVNHEWVDAKDGRFSIPRDPDDPDPETLDVRAPGHARLRRPLPPDAGALGDLILGTGERMSGQVVDAVTREPIAGAAVWAVGARGVEASEVFHTAPDGRFEIEHAAGWAIALRAEPRGHLPAQVPLTGSNPQALRMEAQPGGVIEGHLTCGITAPREVYVELNGSAPTRSAPVGPDGHFRLTSVPPGAFRLTIHPEDACAPEKVQPFLGSLAGGGTRTVNLMPGR